MSMASMEKHLFNLKFASKELERCSKKSDKEEKAEKLKLKKAIEKGNHEVARIHAENAIRQKNQSLNYLRMSARVDATASRVQSAVTTKKVTKSMEVGISLSLSIISTISVSNLASLLPGCREGHGRCHEEHEPGEDQRVDGSVREGV